MILLPESMRHKHFLSVRPEPVEGTNGAQNRPSEMPSWLDKLTTNGLISLSLKI
jgi:hypothetical protein